MVGLHLSIVPIIKSHMVADATLAQQIPMQMVAIVRQMPISDPPTNQLPHQNQKILQIMDVLQVCIQVREFVFALMASFHLDLVERVSNKNFSIKKLYFLHEDHVGCSCFAVWHSGRNDI